MASQSRPTISFIIPAFNAERTISACVLSIARNCPDSCEIIVIDDGSNDGTLNILKEIEHRYSNVVIISQENKGVSSARNMGIEKAQGKWISFVDADDFISDNFICVDFNFNVDLVVKDWHFIDGGDTNEHLQPGLITPQKLQNFYSNYLHYSVFRTPWAKFFKTSIIMDNSIRFDERFFVGEDNLFVLNYLSHCKSIAISNIGYYLYNRPCKNYSLEAAYSGLYLNEFGRVYKKSKIRSQILVIKKLKWYQEITVYKSTLSKICWFSQPYINYMFRTVIGYYPLKKQIYIISAFFISKFRGLKDV